MSNSTSSRETNDERRTILAVDFDYFYAQLEQLRKAEIKAKPIVVCVYSGRTKDSGAVSTANYIARSLGVRSGMPIALAKKILQKNSDAQFIPMDREYYDSESERLMQALRSHSSRFEQVSVDEAYLDISGQTGGDFSLAKEIAIQIKDEILQGERLTCSVGIGPNKLLAKMAVDSSKPDGLTVITPERAPEFLYPLPVGKLFGVGPKTEKKLREEGVQTIGDLANTDESVLSERFGKHLGPSLRDAARGIDHESVKERASEQLSRIITLKRDAESFDFAGELEPLVKDISSRLAAMNLLCGSVSIIAITSQLKVRNRTRTLETPTNSEERIVKVTSELFVAFFEQKRQNEDVEEEKKFGLRRVGIRVSNLKEMKQILSNNSTLTEYLS
ncbi:MAG: Y-family DNA polymerase [Nitrososphaerales archaeon]